MIDCLFCEYCGLVVDGSYIDRRMFFCNPTCAMKQAEKQQLKDELRDIREGRIIK
jgi:hypothetical protein